MRATLLIDAVLLLGITFPAAASDDPPPNLPAVAPGWKIELAADARHVLFPTALVAAPDGTLYVGSDPMDMPGPPTQPVDSVLAHQGRNDPRLRSRTSGPSRASNGSMEPSSSFTPRFFPRCETATAMARPTNAST